MGLIPRKSEEQRAAERAELERRRSAQVEAERTARANKDAIAAGHRASEQAQAEALPKWEYKVLTNSALAGWGDGTIEGLEPLLNQYASHGWRVVTMSFTGQISQAFASDKNHLYGVLERPARGGGHVGHPVVPAAG